MNKVREIGILVFVGVLLAPSLKTFFDGQDIGTGALVVVAIVLVAGGLVSKPQAKEEGKYGPNRGFRRKDLTGAIPERVLDW